MAEEKVTGGMILYPLQYVINKDDQDQSYAICRDINDQIVKFTLNPEDRHRHAAENDTSKSIPQIKKFAERQRSAKNPCFASLDNGKRKPDGIFVGEQISTKGTEKIVFENDSIEVPAFEGKWASIVRAASDSLRVPLGFGYLEVFNLPKLSPEVRDLKLRYEEACRIMQFPDKYPNEDLVEIERSRVLLAAQLRSGRKKMFTGVIIHAKNIKTFEDVSEVEMRSHVQKIHAHYTREGIYGGAIFRVRRGNKVITSLCKSCNSAYEYANKKVKDFDVVYDEFLTYGGKRILSEAKRHKYSVDIIPTERFNCGPMGNSAHTKDYDLADSKIMKTYVDRDFREDPLVDLVKNNAFVYSRVCMRLALSTEDNPSHLLSAIHSFSSPIGSILAIDAIGNPVYELDNKVYEIAEGESKMAVGY